MPPGGSNSPTQNSPLGGLGSDYKPPTYPGTTYINAQGLFDPGMSTGSPSDNSVTAFGTIPRAAGPYMPGDEAKIPLSSLESIPTLKQRLYDLGLLTARTFGNPAVWDANAASAYTRVLDFANMYGMNVDDALNYFPSSLL